jgi:ribosomal protein S2
MAPYIYMDATHYIIDLQPTVKTFEEAMSSSRVLPLKVRVCFCGTKNRLRRQFRDEAAKMWHVLC